MKDSRGQTANTLEANQTERTSARVIEAFEKSKGQSVGLV
jgi:hypothetical protein